MRLLSASRGTSSTPCPSYVILQFNGTDVSLGLVVTRISSHIERARPITSKPGPMFAEEHGTSVWMLLVCGVVGSCLRSQLVLTNGYHVDENSIKVL